MLVLVLGTLRHQAGRTALSVLALAAAIAVMLLFEGFRTGLYTQLRGMPEQLQADLIVSQAGVSNFAAARSSLPQRTGKALRRVEGVASAHALTSLPLIFRRKGIASPVQVIAYVDVGGPAQLAHGRSIEGPREIVVDASLAADHSLGLGDAVEVLGWEFEVVGISTGTAAMFTPAVFARFADLIDLFLSGDLPDDVPAETPLLSYMLVRLEDGADVGLVRQAIERELDWADAHTPQELGTADEEMGRRLLGPVLGLLVGLSYLIGALVVGLTLYGSVQARVRDFAVVAALGGGPGRLAALVFTEALVVTVAAFGLGLLAAVLGAEVVELLQPDYIVSPLAGAALPRTALAVLGLGAVGAGWPLRRVLSIDPAIVFRGASC
jgi:putative ABC transport system permease protein